MASFIVTDCTMHLLLKKLGQFHDIVTPGSYPNIKQLCKINVNTVLAVKDYQGGNPTYAHTPVCFYGYVEWF